MSDLSHETIRKVATQIVEQDGASSQRLTDGGRDVYLAKACLALLDAPAAAPVEPATRKVREVFLPTVRAVLDDLLPANDDDTIFRKESAEAHIRELLAAQALPQQAAPTLDDLRAKSNNAYCDYIAQMRRPECLGFEQKLKDGTFGEKELEAHTRAGELLGRHRALAEAVRDIRATQEGQGEVRRLAVAKAIHRENDQCVRDESWESGYECGCFQMADAAIRALAASHNVSGSGT